MQTAKRSGPVRPAVTAMSERRSMSVSSITRVRRAAEREHLEDGRAIGDEAVRPADLVARDAERLLDPLAVRGLFVERLRKWSRSEEAGEAVAPREVLARALVVRALAAEADELEAQLAELELAAVHQVDDLLPLVGVLGVGAVGGAEVLDQPRARLPLAVRVVAADRWPRARRCRRRRGGRSRASGVERDAARRRTRARSSRTSRGAPARRA